MEATVLHNLHAGFRLVFVLGAPGAGKGTISALLAHQYDLMHYSVGDSLRNWMRDNRGTTLAVRIKHRLDNQGFLTFEDLMPFLCQAIMDAINHDAPKYRGIIIDGFPGCTDQLHAVDAWLSQDNPPLTIRDDNQVGTNAIPSIVFSLQATKHNAKIRYLSRGRDGNDSAQKFENRFTEYEQETVPVEETYKQRGILISIDMDGTKEENVATLTKQLEKSDIWQNMLNDRSRDGYSVVRGTGSTRRRKSRAS